VISIVTPAYNEAANLEALYARLVEAADRLGGTWEWIVVDDRSHDDTFGVVERLSLADGRVRGIRLARNSGSHVAITCGLHHVEGDAAIVLAADLQDPPELIERLVGVWREGAQVVWAARRTPPSGFARLYYWIMRRLVGLTGMPANGADFFLADRAVVEAFRRCPERNASVLALITWLGFRQVVVEYDKQPRASGRSGWTLSRKVKLVVDSVAAFSDLPIRLCGHAGVALLAGALLLAGAGAFLLPSLGAALLLFAAVFVALTGIQLIGLAIVGAYVWRALEEARGRPPYLIERVTGQHPAVAARL
jgi:glycosyltransferase involved in cell wall biosynthesis